MFLFYHIKNYFLIKKIKGALKLGVKFIVLNKYGTDTENKFS